MNLNCLLIFLRVVPKVFGFHFELHSIVRSVLIPTKKNIDIQCYNDINTLHHVSFLFKTLFLKHYVSFLFKKNKKVA